ncbi:hypothetical protein T439DRAFT_346340 [Meredithblackwellia eburnea MCA 4105]
MLSIRLSALALFLVATTSQARDLVGGNLLLKRQFTNLPSSCVNACSAVATNGQQCITAAGSTSNDAYINCVCSNTFISAYVTCLDCVKAADPQYFSENPNQSDLRDACNNLAGATSGGGALTSGTTAATSAAITTTPATSSVKVTSSGGASNIVRSSASGSAAAASGTTKPTSGASHMFNSKNLLTLGAGAAMVVAIVM